MFNKKEDLTSTFLLIMCLKLMQLRYIWEQGEGRSSILPDFKMLDEDSTNPAKGSSLSLDCWRYIFNFLPAPHVQGLGERKGNRLQDREEEKSVMPQDSVGFKALAQERVNPGALAWHKLFPLLRSSLFY